MQNNSLYINEDLPKIQTMSDQYIYICSSGQKKKQTSSMVTLNVSAGPEPYPSPTIMFKTLQCLFSCHSDFTMGQLLSPNTNSDCTFPSFPLGYKANQVKLLASRLSEVARFPSQLRFILHTPQSLRYTLHRSSDQRDSLVDNFQLTFIPFDSNRLAKN